MMRIKKKLFYFILLIVGVLFIQDPVYAAYTKWPGVESNNIQQIKNQYPTYDICIYNTKAVLNSTSDFSDSSEQYSNTSFGFAYDPTTSDLKFINYNLELKDVTSSYVWDNGGFNQSIRFSSDLGSYLVKNGSLSCEKLYFIGTSGDFVLSTGGSLDIYSETELLSSYFYSQELKESYRYSLVKETIVGGTLYISESAKCDEYSTKLKVISDNFYNNQSEPITNLQNLKNADFKSGDYVIAQEYINTLQTLIEGTVEDLNELQLTDNSNGDGFYIGNCKGSGSVQSQYFKLKTSIEEGIKLINTWKNTLDAKLKAADPTGQDPAYAQDRIASENAQKSLDTLDVVWEEYLTKISTGQAITDDSCEGILGEDLLNDISTILTWIRIAAPILLIVLGCVDFAGAVLSDDQQALKKATGKFVKRCIAAAAIFFIPSIIMYLLSFIDKIADVSCDIRLW